MEACRHLFSTSDIFLGAWDWSDFEIIVCLVFEYRAGVMPLTTMQNKTSDGYGRAGAPLTDFYSTYRKTTETWSCTEAGSFRKNETWEAGFSV